MPGTAVTAFRASHAGPDQCASDGGRSRLRAVVTGGTAVVLGLRILARPFDEGTALAEVGLVLLSAVSVATFARLDRPGDGP